MNQQVSAANPFQSQPPAMTPASGALVSAEAERAAQEIQASLVIAKRFPRNPREAIERILNACTRKTLAAGALYSYKRGGTEVSGPSIRLAEALAQEWGNLEFGIRELSSENGVSTVEAYAWDLQTNIRQKKVFHVKHTRYSREHGNKPLDDPRDIYETIANHGARRLRACILGVIPGDVTELAVDECERTQRANVDTSPEAINTMVKYFEKTFGVTQELIEQRIGKHIEAINPGQMVQLKKIVQSMRDGMSKPADWFDIQDSANAAEPMTSDINDQLTKSRGAGNAPESAPESAPGAETGDPGADPGEPAQHDLAATGDNADQERELTYAMVAEALNNADDPEALAGASLKMEQFLADTDNEDFRKELKKLHTSRRRAVKRKMEKEGEQHQEGGEAS